jgi:outer membrane lipoprotein SlyB
MARSHHRKKHKEHLRQFKHSHDTAGSAPKGKAGNIFPIVGAVLGFAISFFASNGSMIIMAIGLIAGAVIGWLIGKNLDKQKS